MSQTSWNHLNFIPICISNCHIEERNLRFFDYIIGLRCCLCTLEIFDKSIPGVEELLGKKTEICYVTEYSDDKNAIGLKFKTPPFTFEVEQFANIKDFYIRFQFTTHNKENWIPLTIYQLSGAFQSCFNLTADGQQFTPVLWAEGYRALEKIHAGQSAWSILHQIRMQCEYNETHGTIYSNKQEFIPWDLRLRCWKTSTLIQKESAIENMSVSSTDIVTCKGNCRSTRPRKRRELYGVYQ